MEIQPGRVLDESTLDCEALARKYHRGEVAVLAAARRYSPEDFLRLFVTAHGMTPVGLWRTHTYARVQDSISRQDRFFLIPVPRRHGRVEIRMVDGQVWVDKFPTAVRAQSIPHTTPFWYFHYNPNTESTPYQSMTLNLSPSCLESCALCAGAKTGRVNNGLDETLSPKVVLRRVFEQHPEAKDQLDSVAIVTGCFDNFGELSGHLKDVKEAVEVHCKPRTYRVLEHNVATEQELDLVVKDLGYEIFVTLECFDPKLRYVALNGRVGRKGRDGRLYLDIIKKYARYLDQRPELGQQLVRVTYLLGIDSLEVTEALFAELSRINKDLERVTVVPWLSIFTPYTPAMRLIQQPSFGLEFLLRGMELARKYFDSGLLESESGTTGEGYARGLF